jgi:simple sugar transport system permease protein
MQASVRAGSPLLAGTLGEIYTERSGVLNLGLEGIMLMGAVSAFAVSQATGNVWLGVFAAGLVGAAVSLIHGLLCITFKANQYVSGLALTMLGSGLSSLIGLKYIGIRGLSLRPILFGFDPLVFIFILMVPLSWLVLFKTKYGIIIRSVGENPAAADVQGVNIDLVRYLCTLLGGVLIGLSGAYLSVSYIPSWTQNMTSGRGWIVLALTIFASWDPRGALVGAWLFGGIEALQYRLQPLGISPSLLGTIPFVFTIIILVIGSRQKLGRLRGPPSALGRPYVRGER